MLAEGRLLEDSAVVVAAVSPDIDIGKAVVCVCDGQQDRTEGGLIVEEPRPRQLRTLDLDVLPIYGTLNSDRALCHAAVDEATIT